MMPPVCNDLNLDTILSEDDANFGPDSNTESENHIIYLKKIQEAIKP